MPAVTKWTLKIRKTSTIWWTVGIVAFMFINLIFYPSFKDSAAELQKSFDSLPEAAVQLFGGSTDFFSPVGYLNSQVYFLMLPLLFGMLAITLGSSLLAREEQDKTIESVLSRPISRSSLLAQKALAGGTILIIASFINLFATLVIIKMVDLEIASIRIVEASFVCFLMVLSFGTIAYLFTATGRAKGASLGITALIAFGGYVVSSLAGTVKWLEGPSKVLPFNYYKSESILRGTYNWNNVWFFVFVIVVCAVGSWVAFRRRDLS